MSERMRYPNSRSFSVIADS